MEVAHTLNELKLLIQKLEAQGVDGSSPVFCTGEDGVKVFVEAGNVCLDVEDFEG